MATRAQHVTKSELFWKLAQEKYQEQATPFLCMNMIMYTLGHLIEAMLAEKGRHPGSPVRGVPHGDRGVLLRKYLISESKLSNADAECYADLVADRDTFIDGGVQDRAFVEQYMARAKPLIQRLHNLTQS